MIPVTKPYLPNREKLNKYIDGIYERNWLTNNGPLVQELTLRLEEYLGVENLLLVSNGTLALQIAYRALGVSDTRLGECPEAITTPFTFIATASSLKWDGVQPVFADIDAESWCLNPENIEAEITPNTRAIVPVHVFGNACEVEAIDAIAEKHNLKVIYDASHAFSVEYNGESLLKHGDASTLSFHATKLFHTGEGGAIIFKRRKDLEHAKQMISFGFTESNSIENIGVNAKMNEFQAALGLCVLDEMEGNLAARSSLWAQYERQLTSLVKLQKLRESLSYNSAYFPMLLQSEQRTLQMVETLKANGILARRYFFPSLESVELLGRNDHQPVSCDIAGRILCLPIYANLKKTEQKKVINVIRSELT